MKPAIGPSTVRVQCRRVPPMRLPHSQAPLFSLGAFVLSPHQCEGGKEPRYPFFLRLLSPQPSVPGCTWPHVKLTSRGDKTYKNRPCAVFFFFFLIKKKIRKQKTLPRCAVMKHHRHVKYMEEQEKTPRSCPRPAARWAAGPPWSLVFSDSHLSQVIEKEVLIRPCFSWKTRPPPAHWSMACTQEVGLYEILQEGSAGGGGGGWGAHHSSPCPDPGPQGWGRDVPLWGEAGHMVLQGHGAGRLE